MLLGNPKTELIKTGFLIKYLKDRKNSFELATVFSDALGAVQKFLHVNLDFFNTTTSTLSHSGKNIADPFPTDFNHSDNINMIVEALERLRQVKHVYYRTLRKRFDYAYVRLHF